MKRQLIGCLGNVKQVSPTNLVTNGNFASTAGWTSTGSVFNVSGNVANFLANSVTDVLYQNPAIISGHKYYACGQTLAAAGANITMGISDGVSASGSDSYTGGGAYEFWSATMTSTRTGSGILWAIVDNRSSGWTSVGSKYISFIDLTAAFGAGNEPTQAQMDSIMMERSNYWINGTETVNYYW